MDFPGDVKYINHSCNPNLKVIAKKSACTLEAIKDISAGEALTFDYDTTEWDMASPFDCGCGAASCRGQISGYKNLSETARSNISVDILSNYVRSMHEKHSKRQCPA